MFTKINYGSIKKSKKLELFVNDKIIHLLDKTAQKQRFQIEVWMEDETGKNSSPEFTSTISIKTPTGRNIFVKRTDTNLYRSIKKTYLSALTQLRRHSQVLQSQKTNQHNIVVIPD